MLAAIYTRYSSATQDRASTIRQLDDCRRYAAQQGWEIAGEYVDEETSGRTDQREAFLRLIEHGQAKRFEAVIVWALDRFARDRDDSRIYKVLLRRAGVTVHSVTEPIDHDTDEGIIRESIAELFAELESRKTGRRIRAGQLQSQKRGFWPNGAHPYGYQRVMVDDPETGKRRPKLFVDPVQADVVLRIFREYVAGAGVRTITKRLNADGIPTQRLAPGWMATTVSHVLASEVYSGRHVWGRVKRGRTPERETVVTATPAIIDAELWRAACARKAASRGADRKVASSPRPFTGLITCAVCGGRIRAVSKGMRGVWQVGCMRRKRFGPAPAGCDMRRYIPEPRLAAVVIGEVVRLLSPARLRAAARARVAAVKPAGPTAETREREIRARLADVEARLSRLWDAMEGGQIPVDEARRRVGERERERDRLDAELAGLKQSPAAQGSPGQLADVAPQIVAAIRAASGADLRRLLASIGCRIVIGLDEIRVSVGGS